MDKDLMEELGLMATDSQLEELSKDEASDIIDELKGELGYD